MRHLVLVLTLFAACAGPDEVADTIFDPCSPLIVVASTGTSPAEVDSIEVAFAAWSTVIPVQIEVSSDPGDGSELTIAFESGDTFYRAIYWDAFALISISRDRLEPSDYAIAIAHELGHAFGLSHISPEERPSVMNVGNLDLSPSDADGDAVRELWSACESPQE